MAIGLLLAVLVTPAGPEFGLPTVAPHAHFPGLGLGALIGEATEVSDAMINAAARALSHAVTEQEVRTESLYPAAHRLREVTVKVAAAVVRQAAVDRGAQEPDAADAEHRVRAAMWEPVYPTYRATTQMPKE